MLKLYTFVDNTVFIFFKIIKVNRVYRYKQELISVGDLWFIVSTKVKYMTKFEVIKLSSYTKNKSLSNSVKDCGDLLVYYLHRPIFL